MIHNAVWQELLFGATENERKTATTGANIRGSSDSEVISETFNDRGVFGKDCDPVGHLKDRNFGDKALESYGRYSDSNFVFIYPQTDDHYQFRTTA